MIRIEDLMLLMGSDATDEEVKVMMDLLRERGITEITEVEDMDNCEFFALVATAASLAHQKAANQIKKEEQRRLAQQVEEQQAPGVIQ